MGKAIYDVYIYSISDLAKELEVSEQTIRKYIKLGRMKSLLIGRTRFITLYQLQAFLLGEDFKLHHSRR